MSLTTRDDPLNELLLPASDLVTRIMSGEKRNARQGEKLLAAALAVLLQERAAVMWLIREQEDRRQRDLGYIAALESALPPAALAEVKGYRRLLDTDVKSVKATA